MGGEERASEPILGREGYLERLTKATFQVQVEEGQVRLLLPDFAYSGFLRPETARIKLYSHGEEIVLTLEVKKNFSAGVLDLGEEAAESRETSKNGSALIGLGLDSTVYFKYQNHPGAIIALEKVRIGKGADSEYGFKKVFNSRKELKEYCSARNSVGEEDFSILLERAEKAYASLEDHSEEEDFLKKGNISKTVLTDSKLALGKPVFPSFTAIQDWFQGCLDQNESGELLTHEEEVELAKQRDRADYLQCYAFAAVQTVMAAYFPEAVSPLFAEAYAVLEAIISSDENGSKNLFPQYFITKGKKINMKGGYLIYAQKVSPPLEEILTLTKEIKRDRESLSDSLSLEFPEEFFSALSRGFAEPGSIPPLKLKSGKAGFQSKLAGYQQLLIQIPFQDRVRKQILAGALSTGLEFIEDEAEQKTEGLSVQEKEALPLILNCSRAYQRGKEVYAQTIDTFLAKNYKLCFDLARKISAQKGNDKLQLFDYFQEGVGGMKIAAEYFEWERGYKFSTYATWWIRQKIIRGITDTARTVRLPVHVQESVNHLLKVTRDLRSQLHREPTTAEISAATSIPEKKVNSLLNMQRESLSLEHYLSPEDNDADSMLKSFLSTDLERLDGFVHRPISPLKLAVQAEVAEVMNSALAQLTPIEELIIRMRNGLDPFKREYTLEDVGRELGRTRERVRQLEEEGLSDLKKMENLRSCW